MLTNKTTNESILKMFRKARRLVKAGEDAEAIQLISGAELAIRRSNIYFYVKRTQQTSQHEIFKTYVRKIYSKLFCVLQDLKMNIQNGMTREAVIKLDKIINTDVYAYYIKAKITRSDNNVEHSYTYKRELESIVEKEIKLHVLLKGWKL